jgi:hypothetical protein
MSTDKTRVPKALAERYAAITALTDAFCNERLNDEYAEMIQQATAALCRKRPPLVATGLPASWAAGVTHAIGTVNFVFDRSRSPHVTAAELYGAFGVAESTGQGKSKRIRDVLRMGMFDPDWTLPSRRADNPRVWLVSIDGFVSDARSLKRDQQVSLYEAGLIPFVHADRAATFVNGGGADDNGL